MYQPETQKIQVDFNQVLCDDFLGMNAVYHGFNYMPEYTKRGFTEADRAVEYRRLQEARLRIARTMFVPAMNCLDIKGPYDMHCQRMEAFRKWCQDMKDLGIEIALQTGWHFTRNTYWGHDAPNDKEDPEDFANWAVASFRYLLDDCGLDNIKYAILFTEPTSYASGEYCEGWTMWTYYVRCVRALDKKFREAGLRDRLQFVGPNNTSSGIDLDQAVQELNDVIDIYSSHDYNFVHQGQWAHMSKKMADIVAPTGKPFWLDEYGVQLEVLRMAPNYGNFIAQMITASMAAGHQTSMIWTLIDQLHMGDYPMAMPDDVDDDGSHNYNRDSFHNGIHRWGVASCPIDDFEGAGSVYPAWYAYVLLSKALGGRMDGGKVRSCKAQEALTIYAAAVEQDGEYTVLTVTANGMETPVCVCGLPEGKTFYKHVYAPYSLYPAYGTENKPLPVRCENGEIEDTIPAGGFAIFSTREVL